MPQGLHDELPRESVEIQPGATPVPGAGERARMIFGTVAGAVKNGVDELQGKAHPEAAGQILAFRGRLLKQVEDERSQLALMGALAANTVCLMLQLLTDCHIAVAETDPTCIDDLLHTLSTLIVLVFAIETALLVYCLRRAFFKNPLYTMDLCCVSVAVLSLVLFSTDAFSLLLISRSWRVANFVVRRFELQSLGELVEREVSTAVRDIEAQNQQLVADKAMLQTRIAELERDLVDAQPILGGRVDGGGSGRIRGGAAHVAAASPAKARQPLM